MEAVTWQEQSTDHEHTVLSISRSVGFPSSMTQTVVANACGTYTVWVSSCGLSACSGNTGCGGSPMGTQPRDLLIAWLSFLAGDFCEEGRAQTKRCHRVGIAETVFELLREVIYITRSTVCWLCQKCGSAVVRAWFSVRLYLRLHRQFGGCHHPQNCKARPLFCIYFIWTTADSCVSKWRTSHTLNLGLTTFFQEFPIIILI